MANILHVTQWWSYNSITVLLKIDIRRTIIVSHFLISPFLLMPISRVPLAVASNLVQANIHNGSVLNYPGRLVAHRSNRNQGSRSNGTRSSSTANESSTVVEDISTVTALQQQIISTVAAAEMGRKGAVTGEDVILVDQQIQLQSEDATEMDVTGLGAGGDSDQRLLLGSSNGSGAMKEGSVGRKTCSKQKKIFIKAGNDQSAIVHSKEKPMVTIVNIGGGMDGTEMRNVDGGEQKEGEEEDAIDILAHL